jgi:hypothetical protein
LQHVLGNVDARHGPVVSGEYRSEPAGAATDVEKLSRAGAEKPNGSLLEIA